MRTAFTPSPEGNGSSDCFSIRGITPADEPHFFNSQELDGRGRNGKFSVFRQGMKVESFLRFAPNQ
jgi:hypothetical protein